ncbi:hypothetical protein ACFL1X_02425 [Candidatus Hydrogenedentota bacterium]
MALDTSTLPIRSQIGGLLVPTTVTAEVASTTAGIVMITGGSVALVSVALIASSSYLKYHKNLRLAKSGQAGAVVKPPANGKFLLSLGTGATLLVSVGSAMLPRTRTAMIVHITAGFLCVALTLVHIYTYRKVIKGQTKKFWKFLSSSKTAVSHSATVREGVAGVS